MKKFEKAQKGDKVYSLIHGLGSIHHNGGAILTIYFENKLEEYYIDGKFSKFDEEPVLFWNRPLTPDDPAPKRIIKKTITRYCNLYKAGGEVYTSVPYSTQKLAHQAWQGVGPHTIVLLKEQPVTFEYEEEE